MYKVGREVGVNPDDSCWRGYPRVKQFLCPATTVLQKTPCSTTQMYVISFILEVSFFMNLGYFHDLDMSSHVRFHDYTITRLFHDLANMNKNLSISAGLNSDARNGQEQHERVRSTHNNTQALTLLDIEILNE